MPRIRKQILAPGFYWARDHKGKPIPFPVTADDIKHFARVGNEMLQAKLSVPLPLEHQDATPLTRSEKLARSVSHNTGWTDGYDVQNGSLWATLDVKRIPGVRDADIERTLKDTVKFVSPDIWPSFTDGAGRTWGDGRGVITHIALTPSPVWAGQLPFGGDGAASLSLTSSPATGNRITVPVRLSLNDLFDPQKRRFAMADEKKDEVVDETPAETPEVPAEPEPQPTPEPEPATHDYLGEVKKLLAEKVGLNMPSATTAEKFLEHLCVALHAMPADEAPKVDEPQEKSEMDLMDNQPKEEPMQTMAAMSLACGKGETVELPKLKTVLDKSIKALSQKDKENARLKAENVRLSTAQADAEHARLTKSIAWLEENNWLDKPTADDYRGKIGAKKLSLVSGNDSAISGVQTSVDALVKQAKRLKAAGKVLGDKTAKLSLNGEPTEQTPPTPTDSNEGTVKALMKMSGLTKEQAQAKIAELSPRR